MPVATPARGLSLRVLARLVPLFALVAATLTLIPATSANAAVTSLVPTADAYVGAAAITQNHGYSSRLIAKASLTEFYVGFTVPAPPTGYQWTKAELVLRRLSVPQPAGTLSAARVTSSWTERGVTWQTRPNTGSTTSSVWDAGTATSTRLDVTKLLGQGAISFALRSSSTSSTIYGSRESTQVPRLELTSTLISGGGSSGCFSARGIPCAGAAYVGATVGPHTTLTQFESYVGGKLGMHRSYWRHDQVDSAVSTAKSDLAGGRMPWMSFTFPYSWSDMAAGRGDTWARNLATQFAAIDQPVWLAFHHEPEKDGDERVWVAAQKRIAPIVRSTAPKAAYTIILTGWHELYDPNYSLDMMWPGDGLVDVVGFDVYLHYKTIRADGKLYLTYNSTDTWYFKPLGEWAAKKGVAWGLAETGISDLASVDYPNYMPEAVASLKARGGVAWAYFNTERNATEPWLITTENKRSQFAKALASTARFVP